MPYPTLFSPFPLGPKVARNRVWMTAHATQLVKGHNFSDEHVAYYAERARGGVGVITMEAMAVHPTTQPYEGKVFAFEKEVMDGYRAVAAEVHKHDTLLFAQLWHRGRQTDSIVSRLPVWAPSPVPDTVYREIPHEMTVEEIDELVRHYRISAEYAVEAGLDGIEIHGLAHGYLLGQFLAPATNHRNDEYGGNEENRFRIVDHIIRAVREVTPADRVLGIRINGRDGDHEGALTNEDWVAIAQRIAATGALDYISVSSGTYLDRMRIYGSSPTRHGFQLEDTAEIRRHVELPVVAVGRIVSPDMAEAALTGGTADFVGMTRQLIADPFWAQKAQSDRANEIRPCVGANWCLTAIVKAPLACIHNPLVGKERQLGDPDPASTARRVAVVGGGPAGLRAALTARQRGHSVVLFEKSEALGGQVRWIAEAQSYREWLGIVDWLEESVRAAGVDVRLQYEVTADLLTKDDFDVVVVATGSSSVRHGWTALRPRGWATDAGTIPGADQFNVITVDDLFLEEPFLGASVLIYDDSGDRQAVVAAEVLRNRGHSVTIATPMAQVAPTLSGSRDAGAVYRRLRSSGVSFLRDVELQHIEDDVLTFRDIYSGEPVVVEPVDTVVLCTGRSARDDLLRSLRGTPGLDVVGVGDAVAPRRVFNAIYDGELVARDI